MRRSRRKREARLGKTPQARSRGISATVVDETPANEEFWHLVRAHSGRVVYISTPAEPDSPILSKLFGARGAEND